MASLKEIKRAGKFKKIGQALTAMKHSDDRDYHTGRESEFKMFRGDTTPRLSGAPEFKTPQWLRGVKQ